MKNPHPALMMLLPFLLGGCGILVIPSRLVIPGSQTRAVVILDQETRQAVPTATASFETCDYKDWMPPAPAWGCVSSSNEAAAHFTEQPGRKVWRQEAAMIGEGLLSLAPEEKTGWTQVWFPLTLPVGSLLYRTYDGRFFVGAPGYRTIWIGQGMFTDPPASPKPGQADSSRYFSIEKDLIQVFLPREASSPNEK